MFCHERPRKSAEKPAAEKAGRSHRFKIFKQFHIFCFRFCHKMNLRRLKWSHLLSLDTTRLSRSAEASSPSKGEPEATPELSRRHQEVADLQRRLV